MALNNEVVDVRKGESGEAIVVIHGAPDFMAYLSGSLATLTKFTEGATTRTKEELPDGREQHTITIRGMTADWSGVDNIVDRWFDLVEAGFLDRHRGIGARIKKPILTGGNSVIHNQR